MKAVVYQEYGTPDVLEIKEIEKPTPGDNEVLVKIQAVALNAADGYLLSGKPYLVRMMAGGMRKPKNTVLGADIAGRVEAVGKNVKEFQPGDEVFGDVSANGFGGLAEYICADESALLFKPKGLTFQEAAAVPMAAVTALQGIRDKGKIRPGQKVVINGASGGVGTYAVQIAKSFGAEVTAVCSSNKMDMVRSIGADHIIDYTQKNFTKNGQRYDLIIAANGFHPISDYRRVLNPGGTYVCTGGTMSQIFQSLLLGPLMSTGGKKMVNLASQPNKQVLLSIKELLEARKIVPVIDRSYTLEDTADAFRYLAEGHAKGKIVISMDGS